MFKVLANIYIVIFETQSFICVKILLERYPEAMSG